MYALQNYHLLAPGFTQVFFHYKEQPSFYPIPKYFCSKSPSIPAALSTALNFPPLFTFFYKKDTFFLQAHADIQEKFLKLEKEYTRVDAVVRMSIVLSQYSASTKRRLIE